MEDRDEELKKERQARMRLFSRQTIADQTVKAENYTEQSIG